MSSKINVTGIISGHIRTLKRYDNGKYSFIDIFTFFLCPIFVASLGVYFNFKLTDSITSLLVNFGAIFTALLLSVLVLVYDQGMKIEDKIKDNTTSITLPLKQTLLNQLHFNICYSIILSLGLVFLSLIGKILNGHPLVLSCFNKNLTIDFDVYFFAPITIFLTIHLMLTILMIVKRMHTLLIST